MGFWSKLLGKKDAKFDPFAVDGDGDGKVQDGTIWERPAELSVDLDATLEKAEELLKVVAPEADIDPELEKKAKRQAAAKKAAATRAANRAKAAAATKKPAAKKAPPTKKK
jgi:topoisomerase IA-like protein